MSSDPRHIAIAREGTQDAPGPLADEIARLELLRRLSRGAAHTLNNSFTAILGETLCLLDERKDDPVVAEACQLIQGEIERCARLTRSVALRVQRREPLIDEANLSSLLRTILPVLRETVSRSIAIECAPPEAALCVRGAAEEIEQLVLLCAHRLARGVHAGGALRIAARRDASGDVRLDLVLAPARERRPAAGDESWDGLVAMSLRTLAARHGIELREERDAGADRVVLRFAPAPFEG